MACVAKPCGYVLITVVNPPKASDCKKDARGNLRYNISIFNDSRGKSVFMELYRCSKEDYLRAMESTGLKVLEVSDKTFGELDELGAVNEKIARKFDISSKKVRVNLIILARKFLDFH